VKTLPVPAIESGGMRQGAGSPVTPLTAPSVAGVPVLTEQSLRFRDAMSHLASGVVLVTASLGGRPWGMTVSAACPICLEPPTMLVSLASRTVLAMAVSETGRFGVNVLGEDGLGIARFGASVGASKFLDDGLGLALEPGTHPASVMVDGALAHVDCAVVEEIPRGSHTIFLGQVLTVGEPLHQPGPLVHYRRDFWKVGQAA
jgi:flavin reductase ActVB